MIELADKNGFKFDTVQMPLNVMDAHYESFEKLVIPAAQKRDIGIIGMKPFGDHAILDTGAVPPLVMLRYGMNLPTSVMVTGIDKPEILDQALDAAAGFKPMNEAQVAAILEKTAQLALDGKSELYKTTHYFDSTFQNPKWLG
jgi:predicted aldo/keto reductase-like oxidoreductase